MKNSEHKGGLQWSAERDFREGRVIAQVQTATGYHGRLFSVRFGRENPRIPESLTPYLEARDLAALRAVVDEVEGYFLEQQTAQLRERFSGKSNGKRDP
jgi:hypothetical protein